MFGDILSPPLLGLRFGATFQPPGDTDSMEKFFDLKLSALTPNFNIPTIPQDAVDIFVAAYMRSDRVANSDVGVITFNGDLGPNYYALRIALSTAGVTPNAYAAANNMAIMGTCANNAPANAFSTSFFHVLDYTNTTDHKSVRLFGWAHLQLALNQQFQLDGNGIWKNANPVTSINIAPMLGLNWMPNSRLVAWKIK